MNWKKGILIILLGGFICCVRAQDSTARQKPIRHHFKLHLMEIVMTNFIVGYELRMPKFSMEVSGGMHVYDFLVPDITNNTSDDNVAGYIDWPEYPWYPYHTFMPGFSGRMTLFHHVSKTRKSVQVQRDRYVIGNGEMGIRERRKVLVHQTNFFHGGIINMKFSKEESKQQTPFSNINGDFFITETDIVKQFSIASYYAIGYRAEGEKLHADFYFALGWMHRVYTEVYRVSVNVIPRIDDYQKEDRKHWGNASLIVGITLGFGN